MPDVYLSGLLKRDGTPWSKPVLNLAVVDAAIIEMTRTTAERPIRPSWDEIASAIGVGRNTVIYRAKAIGCYTGPLLLAPKESPPPPELAPRKTPTVADRAPLPPGDPKSWRLLTDGTVLEGVAYVYIPHPGINRKYPREPHHTRRE